MTSAHGSGVRRSAQALEQRVLCELAVARSAVIGLLDVLTAWPPNWLRSAALTLAANDSSWREAKRANSAAVITGAGTSSLIASSIVQRPSPESST